MVYNKNQLNFTKKNVKIIGTGVKHRQQGVKDKELEQLDKWVVKDNKGKARRFWETVNIATNKPELELVQNDIQSAIIYPASAVYNGFKSGSILERFISLQQPVKSIAWHDQGRICDRIIRIDKTADWINRRQDYQMHIRNVQ